MAMMPNPDEQELADRERIFRWPMIGKPRFRNTKMVDKVDKKQRKTITNI
jgi:hypothetical protein